MTRRAGVVALALLAACTSGGGGANARETGRAESAGTPAVATTAPAEFATVRFAIVAQPSHREDVWVQVDDEGSQPAWITLMRGAERVFILERCELADCGEEPAVCGAGFPMVRNIGGDASQRSVELTWDGRTSVRASSGCETRERVQAAAGPLTARICWSARADRQGGGGPLGGPGRIADATCVERQITSRDTAIVVTLPR